MRLATIHFLRGTPAASGSVAVELLGATTNLLGVAAEELLVEIPILLPGGQTFHAIVGLVAPVAATVDLLAAKITLFESPFLRTLGVAIIDSNRPLKTTTSCQLATILSFDRGPQLHGTT